MPNHAIVACFGLMALLTGAEAGPAQPESACGDMANCATISSSTSTIKSWNGATATTTNTTTTRVVCPDGKAPKADVSNGQARAVCVPIH